MIKMNEDMLKQIIIDTIKGEKHLGENLKEQCVDYIEQLQNKWNELKNIIEKGIIDSKAGSSQQYYFNTIYKYMQELEQGKDD